MLYRLKLTVEICFRSYRLFGLLPIIQWAQSLNDPATAPKDSQIRLLEKLQAWSMILYYPLEHWCKSCHTCDAV